MRATEAAKRVAYQAVSGRRGPADAKRWAASLGNLATRHSPLLIIFLYILSLCSSPLFRFISCLYSRPSFFLRAFTPITIPPYPTTQLHLPFTARALTLTYYRLGSAIEVGLLPQGHHPARGTRSSSAGQAFWPDQCCNGHSHMLNCLVS